MVSVCSQANVQSKLDLVSRNCSVFEDMASRLGYVQVNLWEQVMHILVEYILQCAHDGSKSYSDQANHLGYRSEFNSNSLILKMSTTQLTWVRMKRVVLC